MKTGKKNEQFISFSINGKDVLYKNIFIIRSHQLLVLTVGT